MSDSDIPLCVDLDGSLITIDSLHESLIGLARIAPARLLQVPGQLAKGKAAFKRWVCTHAPIDAASLPFNDDLLAFLKDEKRKGRRLVLVTASDQDTADRIQAHLGVFDQVIASDGRCNLSGENKRARLVESFGERGFDYVGNSRADLAVWRSARKAIVVGGEVLRQKASEATDVAANFRPTGASISTWIRALRIHQWIKNTLVFVPAFLTHPTPDLGAWMATAFAFLAFGMCASSGYVANDLLDLSADRRHPRKRERPFASGAIHASQGVIVAIGLIVAAMVIALLINPWFALTLAAYYVFTMAYSIRLKRFALIDVMLLAGLYTMRIIAGSAAIQIWPSFWLLGFSIFIFLSLGIVKRYAELLDVKVRGEEIAQGRGYTPDDLPQLQSMGNAAGYGAVIILALYIQSGAYAINFDHAEMLWLLCPMLLFWISRVWLMTTRGHMRDDPIVYAIKDKICLSVTAMMGAVVLLAV